MTAPTTATPATGFSLTEFVISFQVSLGGLGKRQSESFVSSDGTATTCNTAIRFTLKNGQLFADGALVSTSPGVGIAPLGGSSTQGSISTGFSIVNNQLQWANPNFSGGRASFCISTSNVIEAVFIASQRPSDCRVINLDVIPSKFQIELVLQVTDWERFILLQSGP